VDPSDRSVPGQVDDPALRDAAEITARVEADEAAAAIAREEYRGDGLTELVVDGAPALQPNERIHAVRRNALVERSTTTDTPTAPTAGSLWLTSERIMHDAPSEIAVELDDIDEMAISMGRLLLIRLHDGSNWAIEAEQPRLLRVQIAAVLQNRRRA
jgi:hypothetical protein